MLHSSADLHRQLVDDPPSPQSLPPSTDYPIPPPPQTVFTNSYISPESLHLTPVTEEDLDNIDFPPGEHFDVVDGLLVWIPMASGTQAHQRLPSAHSELFNLHDMYHAHTRVVQETTGASKSEQTGKREADLLITKRSSPTSSEENPSPQQKRKENHAHRSTHNPAYALGEFTSQNRLTDIFSKWVEYRRTNVKFYYIFDLEHKSKTGQSYVVVGSTTSFPHSFLSTNGDPLETIPSSSSAGSHADSYYKKVFCGDEVVNVGPYVEFGFTAKQLMSITFMNKKVSELRKKRANMSQQISQLEDEIDRIRKEYSGGTLNSQCSLTSSPKSSSKSPDKKKRRQITSRKN